MYAVKRFITLNICSGKFNQINKYIKKHAAYLVSKYKMGFFHQKLFSHVELLMLFLCLLTNQNCV